MGNVLLELSIAGYTGVALILKNPLNMLYDRLFQLLQGESYKDGVYELINAIFIDKKDPTEQVKRILLSAK